MSRGISDRVGLALAALHLPSAFMGRIRVPTSLVYANHCCVCGAMSQVRPFIDALVDKTRREMLLLLSEGYSLVAPSKAASMLGVSEGELAHLVEAAGWKQDMESGMYTTAVQTAADASLDSYENLQQLAQYMVKLES